MTKIEFINRMNEACSEAVAKNARFNTAVIYAQAALESNWGNSELAQKANNLFSIKAGRSWNGKTFRFPSLEWCYRYGWYQEVNIWRKYANWSDCVIDYANIIATVPWFQGALQYTESPAQFLKALLPDVNKPGWATDPEYYGKINKIGLEMESYGGPKWNGSKG